MATISSATDDSQIGVRNEPHSGWAYARQSCGVA
jgi:hypothetical protein